MTVVTHTLVDVERGPLPNRTITIALYGTVDGKDVGVTGWYEDGAQSISSVQARSDATGQLSADLPPNSTITPANTWYSWMLPTGERVKCVVPVSANPVALADIRVLSASDPLGATITGKSAYELAVENGFVGTETEWLASLVGADSTVPGPPGPPLAPKPSVATVGDLPLTGNTIGDLRIVAADGHGYTWDGTQWIDAGQFQGPPGADGTNGADGAPGTDGRGISSAAVDANGDLTLTLTDATTQGPWHVKGAPGDPGSPGAAATVAVGTVTTGAAGSTAAVTNSGTSSAAVLDFDIPRGDPGAPGDPGSPGPANSLAIGTVTQGTAAATITGTAPSQTLNLTLPKGDPGAPGSPTAFELRGSGSPYGTVTPTSAGVYYTDTAATNGAIRWVSTGTTATSWIVVVGDTGWRNITSLLPAEMTAPAGSYAYVSRVGASATLRLSGLMMAGSTSTAIPQTDGFAPMGEIRRQVTDSGNTGDYLTGYQWRIGNSWSSVAGFAALLKIAFYFAQPNPTGYSEFTYRPDPRIPWPTGTLPGTP